MWPHSPGHLAPSPSSHSLHSSQIKCLHFLKLSTLPLPLVLPAPGIPDPFLCSSPVQLFTFKLHLGDPDLWEVHPQQTVRTSRTPLTYYTGIICSFVSYCTKRSLVPTYQGSVSELLFSNLRHPAHKCVCERLSDSLSCQMGPSGPPRVYVPGCGTNII